ncbi:YciI family protein [Falsihalocynthiibacter sp. S25ZX9]|uniref:YciI family protein n=1 Tax=Falsihalocynthiibacter sp. S25ZX9 TaxID=3240870 RepID=UPI003510C77C
MTNPTKPQIKAASTGMLHKDLYVVMTTPTNGIGPVMENLGPHLEHQVEMEKSGRMFAAGPLWDDDETTWHGEGMFVIRAKSLAHAREIAESDPMHKSGARSFTVRPWMLNEGSVSVRLDYSTGKFRLD